MKLTVLLINSIIRFAGPGITALISEAAKSINDFSTIASCSKLK